VTKRLELHEPAIDVGAGSRRLEESCFMPQSQQNRKDPVRHAVPARSIATYRRRIVRLLIAHDHAAEVEAWLQELKKVQFAVSADVVQTPEAFAIRLRTQEYDVVLATGGMPHWTGLQVLECLRLEDKDTPFIFLGSDSEEESMEESIGKGVSDCVYRNRLARLPIAVAIAIEQRSRSEELDRAETKLQCSEAHYHALAGNPHYGIFRFDVNGQFLTVNKALAAMLGYESADELMARNLATDIIRDPRERAQLFEVYQQTGRIDRIEIEWKRKDGTPMKVRLSGQRVEDPRGAPEESCEIIAEDITAQRASEDHLRRLAATDALTGLANYRKLAETLESEMKRSDRCGRSFAVLAFDLNGMKRINDTHGHLTGNRALQRLANILRFSCRSIDTPARYGGDEFAIVLPETDAKEASQAGLRICGCLADDREEPRISASVGVGVYPENGPTVEALLERADSELYKMKRQEKRGRSATGDPDSI
jgi:diguanylate cyclase (GGDEF)-like protein/PAS domain S-box-containing protein